MATYTDTSNLSSQCIAQQTLTREHTQFLFWERKEVKRKREWTRKRQRKAIAGRQPEKSFLRFSRTWTKPSLITSQTRVKRVRMVRWCIRPTRLTLVCEVLQYCLVQVRQNLKKKKKRAHTGWIRWGELIPFSFFFFFDLVVYLTIFGKSKELRVANF